MFIFLRGDIIPKNVRKTTQEYQNELKIKKPNIIVLEDYVTAKVKILHKCLICGTEWIDSPNNILTCKIGCPTCRKLDSKNRQMKTHEQFIDEMKKVNNKIKIVGQYIGARNQIDCECLICGHKWLGLPTNLLRNHGCPNCDRLNRIKSKEEIYDFLEKEMPYVLLLDDFTLRLDKIKAYCTLCNYEWITTPSELMQGKGCYYCGKRSTGEKLRFTNKQFLNKLKEINPYIQPLEEYKTSRDKLLLECLICGHRWNQNPNTLFNGHGCPSCNYSFGERQISIWLNNNKTKYEPQKKYPDLLGVGSGLLSYDFYLSKYNLLIEYQGIQHFKPIDIFGGENQFKIQQEHDKRKREYVELHRINLLEIKYNENVNEKLNEYFNNIFNQKQFMKIIAPSRVKQLK